MPKFTLPSDAAAKLKEAAPDGSTQFTCRLNNVLVQKLVEHAGRSGNQITRELVSIFAEYIAAFENGVIMQFEPEQRRRIDLIGEHLSMERSEVIRWILAENLGRSLQRAIDIRGEENEAAKKLDKVPKPK